MSAVIDARCTCDPHPFGRVLDTVRAEFIEMPGLHLTKKQAQRLWALDPGTCEAVLGALEASQFIRFTRGGKYVLGDPSA